MINHPNRNKKERAVLVTTSHRGVFVGYAEKTDGATINLRAARNCIYWSTALKGFIGLASDGIEAARLAQERWAEQPVLSALHQGERDVAGHRRGRPGQYRRLFNPRHWRSPLRPNDGMGG